nr:hypothetical protein [Tanacetum cinerariifolium]
MKEVLDQMESELDQHAVDKKCLRFLEQIFIVKVNAIQDLNEHVRAENEKVKQHYKQLYDSIKLTRAKTIEKTTSLIDEIENLKAQLKGKMKCVTVPDEKPKVLTPGVYSIDVELIPPHNRNNREVHLDYLKHLKEGVKGATSASGSNPRSNTTEDRTLPAKSAMKKVEDHPRNNQSSVKRKNHCSKHMTGDRSQLRNFMKKFIETVRLGNDHFGAIIGYGDYVIGDSVISMGCNGVNLIKGNYGTNLYTISVEDIMKSSPICLLSKASKNKSWLWHRWLNHLNFGNINDLAQKDLLRDLPRLKFKKDHICSACQLRKSQKYSHKPKTENTNLEVLNTLHMDLCRPMRVQTINGKKYILVIVDDYYSEDLGKLRPTADIGIFVGYAANRKGVERPILPTPTFQVLVVLAGTPFSTTIDQDAPSTSYSPSSSFVLPHISHQEPSFDESSSGDVSSAKSTRVVYPHNHLRKCGSF